VNEDLLLRELLDKAFRNKSEAEESLKTWLWTFSFNFLRSRIPNASERARIVSDIYVTKLCQEKFWDSLRNHNNPIALVSRSIYNAFLDVIRKDTRQSLKEVPLLPEYIQTHSDQTTNHNTMLDSLSDCLATLNETDRQLIEIKYGFHSSELTFPEFAALNGLKKAAAKKRVERCLPILKACFERRIAKL
jgi:DNA-directed RNA polymerase specialized sigma24 family protein